MEDSIYLEDHPPARTQYRAIRRAEVTGAIVVHTAENDPDLTLPDGGAEAVARFIARRTDAAGSYHSIVDSDTVVHLGRYEWEMFHEGTGGNRWSLGLSFACHANQWPTLPNQWATAAIRDGANEAARMAAWVHATTGIVVPARRINAGQYRAGMPGFIGHSELDRGRRSDPGPEFPWDAFLHHFAKATSQEPTMPTEPNEHVRRSNSTMSLLKWLFKPGPTIAEKLTAEEERTGITTRIHFDRSSMQWEGRAAGMSGYVTGITEAQVTKSLVDLLRLAPDLQNVGQIGDE